MSVMVACDFRRSRAVRVRSRARTHSHGRKPPLGVVGNVLRGERFQPFQKGWTDWWLPRSRIAHALLHSDEW